MTWRRSALHAVLAVSICTNAWLANETLRLRGIVTALTARHSLPVGAKVPRLRLMTLEGKQAHVRFDESDHPTLLYILSPSCRWCERNAASVVSLADQLRGRIKIVGISISPNQGDKAPSPSFRVPFPIYTGPAHLVGKHLKIRSTPTTILVSRQGVVEALWEGAYADSVKSQMESRLGIILPVITPDFGAAVVSRR